MCAAAAIDDVAVAIDEAGGDKAAFQVIGLLGGGCLGYRANPPDLALFDQNSAIFDEAIGFSACKTR